MQPLISRGSPRSIDEEGCWSTHGAGRMYNKRAAWPGTGGEVHVRRTLYAAGEKSVSIKAPQNNKNEIKAETKWNKCGNLMAS